jgi:hypothetical protein
MTVLLDKQRQHLVVARAVPQLPTQPPTPREKRAAGRVCSAAVASSRDGLHQFTQQPLDQHWLHAAVHIAMAERAISTIPCTQEEKCQLGLLTEPEGASPQEKTAPAPERARECCHPQATAMIWWPGTGRCVTCTRVQQNVTHGRRARPRTERAATVPRNEQQDARAIPATESQGPPAEASPPAPLASCHALPAG